MGCCPPAPTPHAPSGPPLSSSSFFPCPEPSVPKLRAGPPSRQGVPHWSPQQSPVPPNPEPLGAAGIRVPLGLLRAWGACPVCLPGRFIKQRPRSECLFSPVRLHLRSPVPTWSIPSWLLSSGRGTPAQLRPVHFTGRHTEATGGGGGMLLGGCVCGEGSGRLGDAPPRGDLSTTLLGSSHGVCGATGQPWGRGQGHGVDAPCSGMGGGIEAMRPGVPAGTH